jgi:hypothetical protein
MVILPGALPNRGTITASAFPSKSLTASAWNVIARSRRVIGASLRRDPVAE